MTPPKSSVMESSITVTATEADQARVLVENHEDGAALAPPPELARLIRRVLVGVARGETITIGTLPEEITTTAAANMLGISRPTLMKLVSAGELPSHKVGTHTRLWSRDVIAFDRRRREEALRALDELRDLEAELGVF